MAIDLKKICDPEWAEWYMLSPEERIRESAKLWVNYLAFGGSLDPEPDTQSPFFDSTPQNSSVDHGGTSMHRIRRRGV